MMTWSDYLELQMLAILIKNRWIEEDEDTPDAD